MCEYCHRFSGHAGGCPMNAAPAYTCPVCGDEPDEYIYKNYYGDIIGCDCCVGIGCVEDEEPKYDKRIRRL